MTRLQDLDQQAARAERLTSCVTDALTIERLRAFASDCRRQIEQLTFSRRLLPELGDESRLPAAEGRV